MTLPMLGCGNDRPQPTRGADAQATQPMSYSEGPAGQTACIHEYEQMLSDIQSEIDEAVRKAETTDGKSLFEVPREAAKAGMRHAVESRGLERVMELHECGARSVRQGDGGALLAYLLETGHRDEAVRVMAIRCEKYMGAGYLEWYVVLVGEKTIQSPITILFEAHKRTDSDVVRDVIRRAVRRGFPQFADTGDEDVVQVAEAWYRKNENQLIRNRRYDLTAISGPMFVGHPPLFVPREDHVEE